MPPLGHPIAEVRDGENNRVSFDVAYPVSGRLDTAMRQLRQRHPGRIYLLPMSAGSAGGGVFQTAPAEPGTVVGLRFDAPAEPRVSHASAAPLAEIELDQIVIDRQRRQVAAGAAVTLDQLNQALAQELGHDYRVAGADLTSYLYAAVGATFMTGGMGPQRRYFSDSVDEIALYDGSDTVLVGADGLAGYAGTYGWSGIVSALRCRFHRFPPNEVAFALPVRHGSDDIARLLARLAPYTRLRLAHDLVRAEANDLDLILGLEHVSIRSMQPLLRDGGDSAVVTRARELRQNCEAAGAEGLVFVNGCSRRAIDDFLLGLADSGTEDDFSIAGIGLDHAEVFADPGQMRALREAIPWAARMQGAGGALLYKNHSDANVRIVGADVESCARRLWQINRDYVTAVEAHFDSAAGVDGEILVYGHLNPYGFDPHNRVTMSSDDDRAFERSRGFLAEARAGYYRKLAELCRGDDALFIGGEKTADSEIAIFHALDGPQNAPAELYARFRRQRETIGAASPLFNWRALPPFV